MDTIYLFTNNVKHVHNLSVPNLVLYFKRVIQDASCQVQIIIGGSKKITLFHILFKLFPALLN